MFDTLFSLGALGSPTAHVLALLIGLGFGIALERAGFGSSRRLAGVFYFTDMAVIKVMFTAVATAMTGIFLLAGLGVVAWTNFYLLPTHFGPQIIGGLIFGVGFVMSGWCPGTAGVGLASGRLDALAFLVAAGVGSILYNEIFPLFGAWATDPGSVRFIFTDLGMSMPVFAGLFILVAIGAFWGSEWVERCHGGEGRYFGSSFLKGFSVVLIVAAVALFAVPGPVLEIPVDQANASSPAFSEQILLQQTADGLDHLDPEHLANRLLAGTAPLLVDVRPVDEYKAFHLPGAINVVLPDLPTMLEPYRDQEILLYSNGMTHPAQARDALMRLGFADVKILTDGIIGFRKQCLTPVSLRDHPLTAVEANQVRAWRSMFFPDPDTNTDTKAGVATIPASTVPANHLVDVAWLQTRLDQADLKILELREQKDYNGGHLPGSLQFDLEHLRTTVAGIGSRMQTTDMLARHLELMGINPTDTVVLVSNQFRDATLVALALEILGHQRYAILDGGFPAWQRAGNSLITTLPTVSMSIYSVPASMPAWAVTADAVLAASRSGSVIIDSRPHNNYTGEKQDEARGGHIPGAQNRPFSDDIVPDDARELGTFLKPVADLRAAYAAIVPDSNSPTIFHCRTGHQASQGWFILKNILGYHDVRWYDAGWSEWAQRPELPVSIGESP